MKVGDKVKLACKHWQKPSQVDYGPKYTVESLKGPMVRFKGFAIWFYANLFEVVSDQ